MAFTNVLYALVILNKTVWSQISSNCVDNSHEAQLVTLLYCFYSHVCALLRGKRFIVETVEEKL